MNHIPEIQDPRRLETVIGAKDFFYFFEKRSWKRDFIQTLFESAEKYLGTEILLRVPPHLAAKDAAIFKNLQVTETLRRSGLVDTVGFLKSLPDEPPIYRVSARGPMGRGSGASFFDPNNALWSALGECIERSLWFNSSEWYEGKEKISSYKEIPRKTLDPRTLVGFSEEQKRSGSWYVITEDTPLGWIRAKEWTSQSEAWVPLQLMSAHYAKRKQRNPDNESGEEPLLRPTVTTGLATSSKDEEEAILYGTLEVIERDAFMSMWLNRLSPPRVSLSRISEQDAELAAIDGLLKRYRLKPGILLMPTDLPVYAVAGTLRDETGKGPAFVIGAKAHWDLKTAILGALSEAVSVHYSLKNSWQNPKETGKIGRWERLLFWSHPENLPKVVFLEKGKEIAPDIQSAQRAQKDVFADIMDALRKKSFPLYSSEISSAASKKAGFRSVYVCIPDLQPLHLDERAPALYGKRLSEMPRLLGYEIPADLNLDPHPFP